jgi:hypothetical protein
MANTKVESTSSTAVMVDGRHAVDFAPEGIRDLTEESKKHAN